MKFQHTLLTIALSSFWLAYAHSNQPALDAGLLNKQQEQYQAVEKIKPKGELFNQDLPKTNLHAQSNDSANAIKFNLNHINVVEFEGQVVNEDLSVITQPYLNKAITLSDLKSLTQQITQYYRQQDYLVAKAILPPQEVVNGTVTILVIKGKIGEVNIANQSQLRTSFAQRMANAVLADKVFLHKSDLEQLALRLNDVSGINANLSIKAGKEKAKTDLTISLEDSKLVRGYAMIDSFGSTETGRIRFLVGGRASNLLGIGDELKIDGMATQTVGMKNIRLDYSSLVTGIGTKLGVQANYLAYQLGGEFEDLNTEGSVISAGGYISHPLLRLPNLRVNTKVAFNYQHLIDRKNAVELTEKRHNQTANLSLNGAWRSIRNGIVYFNVASTLGKTGLRNSDRGTVNDGIFTTFNYALSYEHFLPSSFVANLAASGQFATKNLDSSQKMLLGGQGAVRGYRSGVASVDEGHLVQAELKYSMPLFQQSILSPSVFYDYARGKLYKNTQNIVASVDNHVALQSVGVNLNLASSNSYNINLTVAKPIGRRLSGTDTHYIWFSAVKTF